MRLCDTTVWAASTSGREFTVDQYIEAGEALADLGVPFLQAGAPAKADTQRDVVRELSERVSATVIATAEPTTESVETALSTGPGVIEVEIPVSKSQLEHRFGCSRDDIYDRAEEAMLRAHEGGVDVHLTLEDAFRTEIPAIAGAFGRFDCPIVLADSVGTRTPPFVAGFLRTLADASADLTRAGVRFRNDLGCATANALVAAETGIDRVDVSVAGLGAAAGPAATEEVIVATEANGGDAGVASDRTIPACQRVLEALGESVHERKPILGDGSRAVLDADSSRTDGPDPFRSFDPETFGG